MAAEELIEKQLLLKKIHRDCDVEELYLANSNLESLCDLRCFKNLQRLWLNENKLLWLNGINSNYRLTELYLQDNKLLHLDGCLQHLANLEVLMLQGNQLRKLTDVVHELRKMQKLRNLNLFGNPLAQEFDYRSYVIHHLPSVQILDRKKITKDERDIAHKKYEHEREAVNDTIAFSSCVLGPPERVYFPENDTRRVVTLHDERDLFSDVSSTPEMTDFFQKDRELNAEVQDSINRRAAGRSVMEYTSFNWSKVPKSQEKIISDKPKEIDAPQLITVRFR